MARGRDKQRGGGRKNSNRPYHSSNSKFKKTSAKKRDSSHIKETVGRGENDVSSIKRRNVDTSQVKNGQVSSSSEDDSNQEPQDHFKQLLSTFSNMDRKVNVEAIESDDSSDVDDNDGESEGDNKFDNLSDSSSEESTQESADLQVEVSEDDKNISMPNVNEDNEQDDDPGEGDADDSTDYFMRHFHYDVDDSLYEAVSKEQPTIETHNYNWPILGNMTITLPRVADTTKPLTAPISKVTITEKKQLAEPGSLPVKINDINWSKLHLKTQLQANVSKANKANIEPAESLTPLQTELFSLINCYQDVYFPNRTLDNGEEVRFIYCLHAVNHVLKSRNRIVHHNAKLTKRIDVPDAYRDQGLVRPKVVILVPFRDSALRVIKMIIAIFFKEEEKANIVNLKRFIDEHTGDEIKMPKFNRRPEDYEATFSGDTDDTFRIGLTVNRSSMMLYADFYSADIIVASPLGLRVIVGADGESERDFDFLASVELLVLDQTELFLMQNWDHLLHVLDHFHLQPKESHGTDFSRVRSWALNGWARYYRQTLMFAALALPEINALCNKKCHNYAGKAVINNPISSGSICQVVVQQPQVFHQFSVETPAEAINARFNFFVKKILPQFKDSIMNHTMIYVPSYFDYVYLRNYLKREELNFVQICEYSKDGKVARARDMFFHNGAHFLLYSERFHFFRRPLIKGIRHLIFYQLPTFPHLYPEMCNMMIEANQNKRAGGEGNTSVAVLYCKYDAHRLAGVVSTERARRMLASERNVHLFTTGE